jgi:hypothetical protein
MSSAAAAAAAVTATAAAAFHVGIVTTPLDVLKTRLMTQGTSGRYKNLIDATIQVRIPQILRRGLCLPACIAA